MITIKEAFRSALRRVKAQTPTASDVLLRDTAKPDTANNADFKVSLSVLAGKLFDLITIGEAAINPKIDDGDAGVTVTSADQTSASATVTIPNIGDAADTFAMNDTAATLTNKTLTAPVITAPAAGTTGILLTKRATFAETATGVSHVATIPIPAGAIVHSIKVIARALWAPTTSATLKVGDTASDSGYFTGVNLKATDLLVGEVLETNNDALWGGKEGAYLVAATGQRGPAASNFGMSYVAGSNIIGTITVVDPTATAGRTDLVVEYSVPATVAPVVT